MRSRETGRQRSSLPWAIAVTIIAVVAILSITGYLIFRATAQIPITAVEKAEEALGSLQDLAAAFRQGTIEHHFVSYATQISGHTYLQVATIDQVEEFTREDHASIFWGTVQLPEVVVSATAPVQYTAYVDLNEPWHLQLIDRRLQVSAPPIRFNQPAIDVSSIRYEVVEDSLLRDEEAALETLKAGLTSHAHRRTQELEPTVRETARSQIEGFVRTWLAQSFPRTEDLEIVVDFDDETPDGALGLPPDPQD